GRHERWLLGWIEGSRVDSDPAAHAIVACALELATSPGACQLYFKRPLPARISREPRRVRRAVRGCARANGDGVVFLGLEGRCLSEQGGKLRGKRRASVALSSSFRPR